MRADAFGSRVFDGRVERLAPVIRETSRQGRIEINVANPERTLKAGMFVRAQIEFERHQDATLVPSDAVVRRGERLGVFQIEGGMARFVPVELGLAEGEWTEILSPELSGSVVMLGQHLLEDSSAVAVAANGHRRAGGASGQGQDAAETDGQDACATEQHPPDAGAEGGEGQGVPQTGGTAR